MASEAASIAWNMTRRAGGVPSVKSMDEARAWVKERWPDWADWIGYQMLDNISETILAAAQGNTHG